jgi:hypothetical protein
LDTDIKSIRSTLQNLKYNGSPFISPIMARIKSHKSIFKKDIIVITDAVGLDAKQLKSSDKMTFPIL